VDSSAARPILVVDDDQVSCRLMAAVLERAGYQVEWTTDPAFAVDRVRDCGYALVVADVQMPQMSGTTLAERVASLRPGMPTLLVSAFADRRARAEARAIGVELLTKPIRVEALLAAVRTLVSEPGTRSTA